MASRAPRITARCLLFLDDLSATGVARNAVAIANALAGQGHQVTLALCRGEGVLRGGLDGRVAVTELLPDFGSEPRAFRLVRAIHHYRRLVRRLAPDVLLSAGNHGHLATFFAAAPGVATVYRISNDLEHRAWGRPVGGLFSRLRALQFRLIARRADRLVLVSPHLARNRLVRKQAARGTVCVIPNGVEFAEVRALSQEPCPHPWLAPSEAPVVLAVARIAPQKNLETLLDAIALARRVRPLRLLILGNGSGKDVRRLEERIRQLRLTDAIDRISAVRNPFPYMARAATLALPSWWEGSSNVLLEALACGTPVVASHSAGNAVQLLAGGRYGRLVDPGDAKDLAAALLAQTGPDRKVPGERAADFSRQEALSAYVALIEKVTRERRSWASKPSSRSGNSRRQPCAAATAATRLRPRPAPGTLRAPGAR